MDVEDAYNNNKLMRATEERDSKNHRISIASGDGI